MNKDTINTGLAMISDICSCFQIPTNTAMTILQTVMNKRAEKAREILFEEIKGGNLDCLDKDEIVSIIYRYMRAAQEGTARLNLRLLAKVIKNQAFNSCLKADEFLYYADLISSLRREEILLLGTLYRNWIKNNSQDDASKRKELTLNATGKELIPSLFQNKEEINATITALSRTGFFVLEYGWDASGYQISPLCEKICQMASFEKAIEQEEKTETKT